MTMNTWPPWVGTWAYDTILWLWSVASGYPVFDYNDMDVKHRLQATTLAKKLTFHIDCPVVRMDRRTSMSWLPKFLGWINYPVGEGGGCTPLCGLYRPCAAPSGYVFLPLFGLKTGIHFAHFGLESGMVFEGTTGVYERIYHINSKWVRKGNMGIGNGFEDFFCLRCNLRPGLKTGMEFRGLVWKRVWKITVLVRNRVRIWRTGRHTTTTNSQEYPHGINYHIFLGGSGLWLPILSRWNLDSSR